MIIFDTHAHLDQIENIEQALQEAHRAGVAGIMAVGVDLEANKRNLELQSRYLSPRIFVGLGLHPGNIVPESIDATLDFIRANIAKAHAVGETGLDFWYRWVRKNDEKKAEQQRVFGQQLEIAKDADLPVIVHSRGAWKECFAAVKSAGITKGVFHWYSGPVDVLKDILDSGFFISTTPSLAYSPQAREAIEFAPIEQTLIETDSPVFFRGPDDAEGFRSGPKDVFRTLDSYIKLKNIDRQQAVKTFNANAQKALGMTDS